MKSKKENLKRALIISALLACGGGSVYSSAAQAVESSIESDAKLDNGTKIFKYQNEDGTILVESAVAIENENLEYLGSYILLDDSYSKKDKFENMTKVYKYQNSLNRSVVDPNVKLNYVNLDFMKTFIENEKSKNQPNYDMGELTRIYYYRNEPGTITVSSEYALSDENLIFTRIALEPREKREDDVKKR